MSLVDERFAGWFVGRMPALPIGVACTSQEQQDGGSWGYIVVGTVAITLVLSSPSEHVHLPRQSHWFQVEQPRFPV